MKIGLIGGGAMGEAIIASLIRGKVAAPADIAVFDVATARLAGLAAQYGVRAADSPATAVDQADYVVFAVKPQDFARAAKDVRGRLAAGATVVSIMAGVTIATLAEALGHEAIVRSMPNTPAQIGEGMTAWTATAAVSDAARAETARIFECLGRQVMLPDEHYIDMATAVSGSGPGYVFLIIEAFIDAGVHIGLSREVSTTMVLQTLVGSARFAQETGQHPAALKGMVSSPGGTTVEGLRALEAGGVRAAITDAVIAAYNRSRALGGSQPTK